MKKILIPLLLFLFANFGAFAQQSIARRWNEAIIQAVREDLARPPITARTLFHTSMAMYDAWAAYDSIAKPYLLGNTVGGQLYPFNGIAAPANVQAAREEAISFAVCRVAFQRFQYSPNAFVSLSRFINLMYTLGYDFNDISTDYSTGSPAALGNLIGQYIIQMGLVDGANEYNYYTRGNFCEMISNVIIYKPEYLDNLLKILNDEYKNLNVDDDVDVDLDVDGDVDGDVGDDELDMLMW